MSVLNSKDITIVFIYSLVTVVTLFSVVTTDLTSDSRYKHYHCTGIKPVTQCPVPVQ